MLRRLADVAERCTAALEGYDHASALEQAERFFWFFCDDYLELVKARAYGELGDTGAASARAALRVGLSVLLRLFAPVLPFVTEEVWSWWQDGSIHRSRWPDTADLSSLAGAGDDSVLRAAAAAIAAIRKAKSAARIPMREPVAALVVTAAEPDRAALAAAEGDVRSAGKVAELRLQPAPDRSDPAYEVELS
jgi:valyl-tRNA synthetase